MTKCEPRIDIPASMEDLLVKCHDATTRKWVIGGWWDMVEDYFREHITLAERAKSAKSIQWIPGGRL